MARFAALDVHGCTNAAEHTDVRERRISVDKHPGSST